ncbi:hypothetical protein IV203_021892 [Nitzschia inconspicua]|uniref:Uncharacterized protein n=1 Tax=Nitzschia inconspicua TaxID=303405 RepID=A0A9K3KIU1_9STRA|nr:hypothetical protein IV203_021892 [Nitzschia inconspicua]
MPPGRKPLKQVTKGGYTNVVSHAKNCYGPKFEEEFQRRMAESGQKKLTNLATQKKTGQPKRTDTSLDHSASCTDAQTAYGWMRFISQTHLPLSIVEDVEAQSFSKYGSISSMGSGQKKITDLETQKKTDHPKRTDTLLDHWACCTEAQKTAFAWLRLIIHTSLPVSIADNEDLQSFSKYGSISSKLENAEDDNEIDLIYLVEDIVQDKYKFNKDDIACLIGNHCNDTITVVSEKWNLPIISCASHRLSLACDHWMDCQPGLMDALDALSKLMRKANDLKVAGFLQGLTLEEYGKFLAVKKENESKMTSTFAMVTAWRQIQKQLKEVEDLKDYLLTPQQESNLEKAFFQIKKLHFLTIKVEEKDLSLAMTKDMFDLAIELEISIQRLMKHLDSFADVVKKEESDSAIASISNEQGDISTEIERDTNTNLKQRADDDQPDSISYNNDDDDFEAFKAMLSNPKRFKCSANDTSGATDGTYITPQKMARATPNCCEKIFSQAKHYTVPHPGKASHIVLEALLFLKNNPNYWNIQLVAEAMRMP